jgi:hypothetical protein
MKNHLMTKELSAKLPALYAQDSKGDSAIAYAHYFSTRTGWDWYATEYDPQTHEFFGLVFGFEVELGYFSLDELEANSSERLGFGVEREFGWEPKTLGEIKQKKASRMVRS